MIEEKKREYDKELWEKEGVLKEILIRNNRIVTRDNISICPVCGCCNGEQPRECDCQHLIDVTYDEQKELYTWFYQIV